MVYLKLLLDIMHCMSTSIFTLQVVAEHLFHEGQFAVGEAFIQEAGIAKSESLKKPFEAMYQVLQEVHL